MNSTINKTELISKLQTLEGLTNEERSNLIDLLRQHKKYGLVWEDKPEDVEERLRDELPVLHEVKERFIDSDAPDAPNHILIEGDNLEALTTLSYTHEGKIDVIYIDPPYNTGNKDFVYNDSFVDSEDSYRHSKWLSFMNKRLKIAKRLLSDRGVIFISIDDNEQASLRLLCDEVFTECNFMANVIWQHSIQPKGYLDTFSVHHNYILMYRRNLYTLVPQERKEDDNKAYSNPDNDPNGPWRSGDVRNALYRPNLIYDIISPSGKVIKPCANGWRWSKETVAEKIKTGEIIFSKDENRIIRKIYLKNLEGRAPETIWFGKEVGTTREGIGELKDIFGKAPFETPKPVNLIKRILKFKKETNCIILDFFAGSGTTLHATMQLNAEDGGHRQCILVTNNENNICEEVTYERNKRVINGYTTPKGVEVEGLKNNRLRYYKTDFISRDRTMRNMRQLVAASTDMLCIKEDLYTEQKMFGRWKINPKVARYFSDGEKHMLVVYDERAVEQLPTMIAETDFGGKKLKIYIFSPERYAFDDDFYEVQDKVQLVALPAAIYDAYQKVLPKRKPQLLDVAEEVKPIPTDLFGEEEKGGEA